MEKVLKKVEEIFRDIFDDEDIIITEETTADDIEDWDSLAYINIIVALKEEFGIDFSMEEVSKYKSVGELVKAIKNKIS
jgi:acyl carrier protein